VCASRSAATSKSSKGIASTAVPFPPFELASRVGSLEGQEDPFGFYDLLGREARTSIDSLLPDDWHWEGKQVLDFGCGAGRTLRHFLVEAEVATFWGCDIDHESIEWVEVNLSPPIRAFVNSETPPLPFDAASFDLIYVVSVFTHLTDTWSTWLLELHRLLKESGRLIATFIGPAAAKHVTDEPWDADRIGMNVLKPGQSWDQGGPMVLHSPWWIEAHWGRAFDIDEIRLDGFGLPSPEGQGVVAMRKRAVELGPGDLEQLSDDPREALAVANNVDQLTRELIEVRARHDQLAAVWQGAKAEAENLRTELSQMTHSRSWRLTAPLRSIAGLFRRGGAV
jgi:SAM-dependent methyltransferase